MQISGYGCPALVQRNQTMTDSTVGFLNTVATGSAPSNTANSDTNQTTSSSSTTFVSQLSQAQIDAISTGTGHSMAVTEALTPNDLALVKQVTGLAIDPATGRAIDANGNEIKVSSGASDAAGSLIWALYQTRTTSSSQNEGNLITGNITVGDLQAVMQTYANVPGAIDNSIVEKAIDVMNSNPAFTNKG
jgi:hypothetical protein